MLKCYITLIWLYMIQIVGLQYKIDATYMESAWLFSLIGIYI